MQNYSHYYVLTAIMSVSTHIHVYSTPHQPVARKDTFTLLWDSLGVLAPWEECDDSSAGALIRSKCELIASTYSDVFCHTIIYDAYYGSAVVYIPIPLTINLDVICAEAAYVHSCGYAVYVRKMRKASPERLINNISGYLEARHSDRSKRVYFCIYAHEYFSPHDTLTPFELRHGLDDIKIHLDRAFLGSVPLVDFIVPLRERLGERLHIHDGLSSYNEEKEEFNRDDDADPSVTIWLVQDKVISQENNRFPGNGRLFICYAQHYYNGSQFILFDER